jgi:hypothetical protein
MDLIRKNMDNAGSIIMQNYFTVCHNIIHQ